jgi:transposase-like protein
MIDLEPVSDPRPKLQNSTCAVLWIGRSTAVLVGLLAIAAFALSFEALRDLAVTTGAIPNPRHAWLFPVLLDGGVVVFSLAALRASLTGNDRRWYMSLVVIVTLLSVGFNVAHASRGFLAGVMAGMPPLLLFMAFESLMRQFQETLKTPERKRVKRTPVPAVVCAVDTDQSEERRSKAAALRSDGWSKSRIARELSVSPSTVSRYLRQIDGAGLPDSIARVANPIKA